MKNKIQIKNRLTGKIIFEFETENNTLQKTVVEAINNKKDLTEANITGAYLTETDG